MSTFKRIKKLKQPIVLIGFMGCGKSTMGQLLAKGLGCPFIDLDRAIEKDARTSIAKIFAREGECKFRAREAKALKRALKQPSVIALGGGTLTLKSNRTALKRVGAYVVWLDVSWRELWRRLSQTNARARPLLWDAENNTAKSEAAIKALWSQRRPVYREMARVRIAVKRGGLPRSVLAKIIQNI